MMKFMKSVERESLILEPEDWTEEKWKLIEEIFGMEKAERIEIRNYEFRAYGKRKDYFGTEVLWQEAYIKLCALAGQCQLGDRDANARVYYNCQLLFNKYIAGYRTEEFYNQIVDLVEGSIIHA